MASMKKLSGFRQLSLNCDPTETPSRRPSLRKQFSEDLGDLNLDNDIYNRSIRNPFVKHAWVDTSEVGKDEPVIIKKCSENKRITSGKLIRHGSLNKETLLNSKQEFAERLRQTLKNREEKPNLKIFLTQNSTDLPDDYEPIEKEEKYNKEKSPKLIQPLNIHEKNPFKIRKNAKSKTILNNSDTLWPVPNKRNENHNNTILVVPVIDNDIPSQPVEINNSDSSLNDVTPIASVIIRPSTAASRREMFQKRTNSAFNATIKNKDTQKPKRPLVRSSSAPCKPDHLKSKQRNKCFKKIQMKASTKIEDLDKLNDDQFKSQKELNRTTALQGNDVVTMVSLVSPAGSDGEEVSDDGKVKPKNVNFDTSTPEPKVSPKIMSLRKAVKTVSFQQSSIHAIRSFSASFPARRGSVSAAMMLNNSLNVSTVQSGKLQEKRSTNSTSPDNDERVPKRRLVGTISEDTKTASLDHPEEFEELQQSNSSNCDLKSNDTNSEKSETETITEVKFCETDDKNKDPEKGFTVNPELKSPKEKQCWSMYCKMAEKGINVSFDTILRGMLTPTEYRLSKKHLLAASNTE